VSDLPHVIAGDHPTEEMLRIYEAHLREHEMPVAGARRIPTAAVMNKAIGWWNGLQPQRREEPTP